MDNFLMTEGQAGVPEKVAGMAPVVSWRALSTAGAGQVAGNACIRPDLSCCSMLRIKRYSVPECLRNMSLEADRWRSRPTTGMLCLIRSRFLANHLWWLDENYERNEQRYGTEPRAKKLSSELEPRGIDCDRPN
jgi:hypothetical protein